MALCMKASGKVESLKEWVDLFMLMVTTIRASGEMVWPTDVVCMFITTAKLMTVVGKTTSNTGLASKSFKTEQSTKVSSNEDESRARESFVGLTGTPITVTFTTMTYRAMVSTPGQMADNTKGTGALTRCMAKAFSHTLMVAAMKAIIKTTRRMD